MKAAAAFVDGSGAERRDRARRGRRRHALRLARLHRQGPRDRQGGDPRPRRGEAGNDRSRPRRGARRRGRRAASRSRSAGGAPFASIRTATSASIPVTAPKRHPNTLRFRARDAAGRRLSEETWLSIGGGFVMREDEEPAADAAGAAVPIRSPTPPNCSRSRATAAWRSPNWCAPTKAARPPSSTRARRADRRDVRLDRSRPGARALPGARRSNRRRQGDLRSASRRRRPQRPRRPRDHGLCRASTRWRSTRRTPPAGASSPRRPTARRASSPRCCAIIATIAPARRARACGLSC